MDSFSDDYSVIAVFDTVDKDNLPIMASINTNGRGNYDFRAINSNYLTSVYGKERFDNFLSKTIGANFLLYADKEKTQTLSSCAKLQLLGAIPQSFRFDAIIHKSINIVNDSKSLEEKKMEKILEEKNLEEKNLGKNRVYLNVHNTFAKIGIESKSGDGKTFNSVTLPKGSIVDGTDLGGGKIYPLDMYIFQNKFNKNLTTVQFKPDQDVQVNFKDGEKVKVKADQLCEAVDAANKQYLSQHKEADKDKSKSITKAKDKDMDIEL